MASALVRLPILSVLRLAPLESKHEVFLLKPSGATLRQLGLSLSDSLNFYASLHQERFSKWSKRDSFGSHKSLADTSVAAHYSEKHYRRLAFTDYVRPRRLGGVVCEGLATWLG